MPDIEQLALVMIGAAAGLVGGWLADRRKAEQQRATRWLERRREVYSSFIHAAREIFHALEQSVGGTLKPHEAAESVASRWVQLEERYSDFLLIASEPTFQAAANVREWCEDASHFIKRMTPDGGTLQQHMDLFWAPACKFLDACRKDLESPVVRSVWHQNAERESARGAAENPYE